MIRRVESIDNGWSGNPVGGLVALDVQFTLNVSSKFATAEKVFQIVLDSHKL